MSVRVGACMDRPSCALHRHACSVLAISCLQLRAGCLEVPFNTMPPEGALPTLPSYLMYRQAAVHLADYSHGMSGQKQARCTTQQLLCTAQDPTTYLSMSQQLCSMFGSCLFMALLAKQQPLNLLMCCATLLQVLLPAQTAA